MIRMIAIVSSISHLLCAIRGASQHRVALSNACATDESRSVPARRFRLLLCILTVALVSGSSVAEAQQDDSRQSVNQTAAVAGFIAGAVVGLGAHEGGHLLFDVMFDADPSIKRVEFHGIPFFAITHAPDLPPRQEYTISAAGFWVQHATNEWILTRRPQLRQERAPVTKGLFAFNVGASMAYSIAAFGQTGPLERDTRGMADSTGIAEPWIGAMILAPAVFDTWRYFDPRARWPVWLSRASKVAVVLLVLK
jgi:hypothetical protein